MTNKKDNDELEHDHDHEQEDDMGKVISLPKTLFLFGEISPAATGNFLAMFTEVDSQPGDITLNICSGGGWVEGGAAMYDLIRSSRNRVRTIANGAVYSSAIMPFMAGDERLMHWSSKLFFHDMSFDIHNGYRSIKVCLDEVSKLMEMYCGYVAHRASKSLKASQVLKWCNDETYFSATEALKLGLIDGIIDVNLDKYTNKVKKNVRKRK